MTIWDDRVLETLRKEGAKPVGEISKMESIHISQPHVSRRCSKLADKGLVVALGNGVYKITEAGEGYLDGEYDAENDAWMEDMGEGEPSAGEEPGEI